MRISVLISAAVILIVTLLLLTLALVDSGYIPAVVFGFTVGGLNLVIGLVTPKAGGVKIPNSPSDAVKLSVDKGVIGSTIYRMAFSDEKLVLKKLSTGRVTILSALIFAVLGYTVSGLIGAAEGGLTAFSVQEFLTQRKRTIVERGNVLDASDRGDLEFRYADLEKVELTRNRLRLYLKGGFLRIVISRKYPDKMQDTLRKIIGEAKEERTG